MFHYQSVCVFQRVERPVQMPNEILSTESSFVSTAKKGFNFVWVDIWDEICARFAWTVLVLSLSFGVATCCSFVWLKRFHVFRRYLESGAYNSQHPQQHSIWQQHQQHQHKKLPVDVNNNRESTDNNKTVAIDKLQTLVSWQLFCEFHAHKQKAE